MSNEQAKHIDMIVTWSLRGIIGLCCFACATIFQSMSSDMTSIKVDQSDMKGDIKGIKAEILEQSKADDRRDRAIEELQRTLNNRGK